MLRNSLIAGLAAVALTLSASADVRVLVRPDGTKAIYNVPDKKSGSNVDFAWLAKQRDRSSPYDEAILRHANAFGVDPVLVKAVIQVESGYDPWVVSSKGARGLMQLMPDTAKRFKVSEIHDPEQNVRGGVQYLATLLRLFEGDLKRALAGYNAGENAVLRHGGVPPYQETELYVRKVFSVYYGRPYGHVAQGTIRIATANPGGSGKKLGGGFKNKRAEAPTASLAVPAAERDPGPLVLGSM
jgi:soluble lytic murein transglycosylase-like protein